MPKTLTLKRASNRDVIKVPIWLFSLTDEAGGQVLADFDTGNDHTCVSRAVFDRIGLVASGRPMPVHGVTGDAIGRMANVAIGIEMDDGRKIEIGNHEVVVLPTLNCDILLGRDVLDWCEVLITRDATTTLTFD